MTYLSSTRILRARRRLWLAGLFCLIMLVGLGGWMPSAFAYPFNQLPSQPGFEAGLILGGAAIDYASPTIADINRDGQQEILIGTGDGKVYALTAFGGILWAFDTASVINPLVRHPGQTMINSAPAVGDIDGDGWPDIVVSVGAPASLIGYNGGMVVLDHQGGLKPGWPQVTADQIGPGMTGPDGYLDGFWGSPAIGDLDNDGDLEIVAGAWDMRVYAWHHDGRLVNGWPKFVYDTVWSSPALADLDQDGQLEIIIGADAHEPSYGGNLWVFRGDGSVVPGFPQFIDQTIFSSPAVVDLDGDGWLDIVVGTGNFNPNRGFAVYAWNRWGGSVPGWPVATGSYVLSSPAVGDITGDGQPEVIVGANDGKLYAFHGNGRPVSGWPVTVYDNLGNVGPLNYSSPVLANFDGDPLPEIFINHFCDTVVFDGNGVQLTHVGNAGPSGKPNMYMFNAWCQGTTPAVGDIDGDGRVEVVRGAGVFDATRGVIGNALVYVWETGAPALTAPWPMFRRDPAHNALFNNSGSLAARIVSHNLPELMAVGGTHTVEITVENTGSTAWTAASGVHLAATSEDTLVWNQSVPLAPGETIAPGARKTFRFEITAPAIDGYYTTAWRMRRADGTWFGPCARRTVKVGNEPAYYVLSKVYRSDIGSVYPGGLATPLTPPTNYWNWSQVQALALTPDFKGYQMLDYQGGVWQGGNAPAIGGHGFVSGARDILLRPDGTSYYILDRYGVLTLSSGAPSISPAPATFPAGNARAAVLTPDGAGVYVLGGDGTIHVGGTAQPLANAPYFGADLARRLVLTADGRGGYVLDSYGRVWPIGDAPPITPNYEFHMGEDWARDIELTADGKGYYLLDKEGGLHTGGTTVAPTINLTPVWPGQDVAVDLEVADSRALDGLIVNPPAVAVQTQPGAPRALTVSVDSRKGTATPWTATADQGWIRVDPQSGVTPGALSLTLVPGSLPPGVYQASVTVRGDGQATVVVPVTMVLVDARHQVNLPMALR